MTVYPFSFRFRLAECSRPIGNVSAIRTVPYEVSFNLDGDGNGCVYGTWSNFPDEYGAGEFSSSDLPLRRTGIEAGRGRKETRRRQLCLERQRCCDVEGADCQVWRIRGESLPRRRTQCRRTGTPNREQWRPTELHIAKHPRCVSRQHGL